jgi:hypothetical protein
MRRILLVDRTVEVPHLHVTQSLTDVAQVVKVKVAHVYNFHQHNYDATEFFDTCSRVRSNYDYNHN